MFTKTLTGLIPSLTLVIKSCNKTCWQVYENLFKNEGKKCWQDIEKKVNLLIYELEEKIYTSLGQVFDRIIKKFVSLE